MLIIADYRCSIHLYRYSIYLRPLGCPLPRLQNLTRHSRRRFEARVTYHQQATWPVNRLFFRRLARALHDGDRKIRKRLDDHYDLVDMQGLADVTVAVQLTRANNIFLGL